MTWIIIVTMNLNKIIWNSFILLVCTASCDGVHKHVKYLLLHVLKLLFNISLATLKYRYCRKLQMFRILFAYARLLMFLCMAIITFTYYFVKGSSVWVSFALKSFPIFHHTSSLSPEPFYKKPQPNRILLCLSQDIMKLILIV